MKDTAICMIFMTIMTFVIYSISQIIYNLATIIFDILMVFVVFVCEMVWVIMEYCGCVVT